MISEKTQLIGQAPAWLSAQEHVSRVAPLDRPILIIGERGTGKELIGERLHFLSRRWDGPFVKVNCAALSETLLDSELFASLVRTGLGVPSAMPREVRHRRVLGQGQMCRPLPLSQQDRGAVRHRRLWRRQGRDVQVWRQSCIG